MNEPNIEQNIRRTVGFTVLKRLAHLARAENASAATEARLARRVAVAIALLALAGAVWLSVRIFA